MPWSRAEAEPLLTGLDKVPGVADAVVDRSFYARAIKHGTPVTDEGALESGHGWGSARMAPYELVSGRAPRAADEIVVDRALGAAVGSDLTVNVTQGRRQFTVVGTVDGPGHYFSEAFAARQQPGVRAIALVAEKGAETGAIVTAAKKVLGGQGEVVGVGVSVIGAWTAGRKAARVAPIEALLDSRSANEGMGRGRWIAGLAVLGTGVLLVIGTATASADNRINMAILATMTLIVAAAVLTPAFIGPVVRFLTAPFRCGGSAGPVLIRAELTANPRRAASLVAPVVAAVGFTVLLSGMVETMRVAYPAGEALKVSGQTIVTPDGTPGNTDEVVAANPVGKAALPTRAFVLKDDEADRSEQQAESAADATVLDVLGSRDPRWSKPGEAVLGESTAGALGLRKHQNVSVRFTDGKVVTLRVGAVLPDDPARGDIVVARGLVRAHDPAALTDDIFVPADARATGAVPGTALHDAAEYALADYNTDAELTDSLASMLIVLAVGYSVIAVVNSMAMAAHGRRRDFEVMRTAGGTVRRLLLISAGETALVIAVGAALGVLVTLAPLAGMAAGLSETTSSDVSLHLNTGAVATAVAGTLLAAVVAGIAVATKTMRRQAA